jgi:hypothetical protein
MDGRTVHFEVYVRRVAGGPWSLELATENRALAISTAEDLMAEGRVAAAKVSKETFDEDEREFRAVTILKLGAADTAAKSKPQLEAQPLCVTPQDLYTIHARERIARLLEAWLERNQATAFELLHRADLVEKLEASGIELQHAIQKIAIPEAHAREMSVHEMIRVFHALIDRAVERLLRDWKRGAMPDLDSEGFAAAAERLGSQPERAYLLGAGVADALASTHGWTEKVGRLLDLADAAPKSGPARTLALSVLEQPLAEILESNAGAVDVMGKGAELGSRLAAMTRLTANDAVERLAKLEPSVGKVMPNLSPIAMRLAKWLAGEGFTEVRTALGRKILRELNGPRRLCPGDAVREIDVLRALAMSLTAGAGKLLPLDDVQAAFSARSKMLVTGDFVEAYLGQEKTAREEVEALIWLTENVIGPANKRAAGGWLKAVVNSLKFEKEMTLGLESPSARLAQLAAMQRAAARCGLVAEDLEPIRQKLGEIGGMIDAQAKITLGLARANAPAVHRLTLLLKLACGESAPLGPAADRAKAEALKLVRHEETRAELAAQPDQMTAVRDLIQQAGLAA